MFQVIKSTILFYIRDKKQALFYLIFPIFLVLLLGNVLSAVMSQDDMIGND